MVKNPPRALFSLKTQHSVGIQINKLNIYKHLSRALSLFVYSILIINRDAFEKLTSLL